jgi:hypothetical protein
MNTPYDLSSLDVNTLRRDRYVRVMLDYCSTGLWDKDGCNVDESDATSNVEILRRLRDWQSTFERRSIDAVLSEAEIAQQQLDGLLIALMIHREHPDWQVVLWDADLFFKGHGLRTPDGRNLIVDSDNLLLKIHPA